MADERSDVVIGAGSGMGEAVARVFAGDRRLVLADRDPEAVDRVAGELSGTVETAACDITDASAVAALVEQVGSIGRFVLTAGLSPMMADGRTIVTVNLVATDALVAAFEPSLRDGSVGVILASSSAHQIPSDPAIDELLDDPAAPSFLDDLDATGLLGHSGLAYGVSKRGVVRMVQRRSRAWGHAGARLISVSPGIIDTPMGALEDANQPEMKPMTENSALRRHGSPDEIAAVVTFLCSPQASFVTGTDVLVDGGAVAGQFFPPA